MAGKKKLNVESEQDIEKPFGTELFGFKKSDVNLYIHEMKKKVAKLEAMLEKAHESLRQAEYKSNAEYEAQIIELREKLREARAHDVMLEVMPEATLPEATSEEFKDIVL